MKTMLNRVSLTRHHSAKGFRPDSQREVASMPGLDWTSA
jgi:hypothetical protein